MADRAVMVPGEMLELACECGRRQPMYIGEQTETSGGGPTEEDLEQMGWTFEPDVCPFCNDPTLIDPAKIMN